MHITPKDQAELRALLESYIGGPELDVESTVGGKLVGGRGQIIEVFEERGDVWIAVDWGLAWIVRLEDLKIAPVVDSTPTT